MEQKPSIGRIVEYFSPAIELPNGMQSAPAIITQDFGEMQNLSVFISSPESAPVMTAWSVKHKSKAGDDPTNYWDWPERV